ncbi:Pentatricopeptide repeat-containing protein, chloroplastic [Stylosanthes scabra]|uniref:Pentatricopeptide repeat-containing protein, chloroplastic n=1 Tax=Stylosanthes scabra TaxID=79078 RepID=A0ABU6YU39_9FABA|nr:Pentatricopeptide repeat-containing protein, chloroplastic [Stylosanthes scabra]
MNDLSKAFECGEDLPPLLGINTGQRKYKPADKRLFSILESHLKELSAPFHEHPNKAGWLLAATAEAKSWLESNGAKLQMAQPYRLRFSSSSTSTSTFNSRSSSSSHFKVLNFPSSSHNPSYRHTQSKTPHYPDAKSQYLSKNHIWVNPRSPRAKHLRRKKSLSSISSSSSSSLLRLAKSLDSCSQQHVPKILYSLGDKIVERDAVFVLDNMLNPEIALIVLEYFQQKINPKNHVVLYNVTLKLFREVKDFKGAEKLFDEMIQRGVKPSIVTFSTMISCAATCSMPYKAVEWFESMPSFECEPDDNIYSTIIYAYARVGNADKAISLYDRAKTEKWHVDKVAFSALIKMHGMAGNYDGCLNVYNDMKFFGAKPNLVTYNSVLYAMGRARRAYQAKVIYEEMVNDGVLPNWPTYAALLQAYCRGRFKEDALSVYKEMKEKGMDMNVVLYNMLLAMCADVGCTDKAVEIFEDMKNSAACRPDSFTFSSLIDMYSCIGKVSEAEETLNEMIDYGIQPDVFVLTSLVKCYGKAKRTDDVVKILNQFLGLGIVPDDRFCDSLLNIMIQTPKEELVKLTDCVEKANPKLGSVVRCLWEEQNGDVVDFRKGASELFNSVDGELKKSFCNNLIDLCVNLNKPDRACDLLDLGLRLGIYTDIQSRSQTMWYLHLKRLSLGAALTALCFWINDLSKALESGEDLPPLLGIDTGLGKHKFADEGLVSVFESHLRELNAPFHEATHKAGWFFTTNEAVKLWLQSRSSTKVVAA